MNESVIKTVTEDKILGVVIDNHLDWSSQVDKIYKTVSKVLGVLWCIKRYLPRESRITFVNAFVLPHLTYCSTVWGTSTHISRLEKLQKRAIRLIFDLAQRDSTDEYLKLLNWLPLSKFFELRTITLVYKCLNNLTPIYLSDIIKPVVNTHTHRTRSSDKFTVAVPRPKLKKFQQSFPYCGPLLWNKLDYDTQTSCSLNVFKQRCKLSMTQ